MLATHGNLTSECAMSRVWDCVVFIDRLLNTISSAYILDVMLLDDKRVPNNGQTMCHKMYIIIITGY